MMTLAEALRERNLAVEHVQQDNQHYDPLVCQCCGHVKKHEDDPECLCDGLQWFQSKDGRVECAAHRFKRIVDGESQQRKFFPGFFRRRR